MFETNCIKNYLGTTKFRVTATECLNSYGFGLYSFRPLVGEPTPLQRRVGSFIPGAHVYSTFVQCYPVKTSSGFWFSK